MAETRIDRWVYDALCSVSIESRGFLNIDSYCLPMASQSSVFNRNSYCFRFDDLWPCFWTGMPRATAWLRYRDVFSSFPSEIIIESRLMNSVIRFSMLRVLYLFVILLVPSAAVISPFWFFLRFIALDEYWLMLSKLWFIIVFYWMPSRAGVIEGRASSASDENLNDWLSSRLMFWWRNRTLSKNCVSNNRAYAFSFSFFLSLALTSRLSAFLVALSASSSVSMFFLLR